MVNKSSGTASYALLDKNGIPVPHSLGGMNMIWPGQSVAGGAMPMGPVSMGPAPTFAPPAVRAVAIVDGPVKPDVWTEYCDEASGEKYYHNPAKGETTWDKPEDFDKNKGEGKPKPPDKPKENKCKCKHCTSKK